MLHSLLLITLISLITLSVIGAAATTVLPNEIIAMEAASFVLNSLKEINDSAIYSESLHLHSIHDIAVDDGLYHTNTILSLELSSEHFASGKDTELFKVVVMDSKKLQEGDEGDSRRGYAIERFPKMKDEAIEDSLRRKVEITVEGNKRIRKEVLSSREIVIAADDLCRSSK